MSEGKKRSQKPAGHSTSLNRESSIEVPAGIFKDKCLAIMDRVRDEGISVLITKHGTAAARLVPAGQKAASAMGYMGGTIIAEGDIVSPDFDAWGEA